MRFLRWGYVWLVAGVVGSGLFLLAALADLWQVCCGKETT
jgi:hypothetical protein